MRTIQSFFYAASIVAAAAGCSSGSSDNPGATGDETGSMGPRLTSTISELDGSETLLDMQTGLVWINDIRFCMAGITTPDQATCEVLGDMAVAGFTDWRIPTSAEMSEVTLAVDADENIQFNYINASCAVMTTSDGWVFTENSNAPGQLSMVQPGNAGVRCVSGESDQSNS
ncbi:MAG: DUF1566 domain-containing protein [Granulosicoccus sp.]|nr:DUF1566 domain-containing protein [Granulosicoccus sp.]